VNVTNRCCEMMSSSSRRMPSYLRPMPSDPRVRFSRCGPMRCSGCRVFAASRARIRSTWSGAKPVGPMSGKQNVCVWVDTVPIIYQPRLLNLNASPSDSVTAPSADLSIPTSTWSQEYNIVRSGAGDVVVYKGRPCSLGKTREVSDRKDPFDLVPRPDADDEAVNVLQAITQNPGSGRSKCRSQTFALSSFAPPPRPLGC
jgi:hypothetical protein